MSIKRKILSIIFLLTILAGMVTLAILGLSIWEDQKAIDSIYMAADGNKDVTSDTTNTTADGQDTTRDIAAEKETEAETEEETEEETTPYEDIIISFTGDILLSNELNTRYEEANNSISGFLSEKVANALTDADLTVVNQEFPFSDRGKPENKEFTFIAPPSRVKIFNDMGVGLVSIANNHIMDYGRDALDDTFTTLDLAGIDYMGAGRNLDRAKQLITKDIKGKTIGFLAASRIVPTLDWYAKENQSGVFTTYDGTQLCEEIRRAKEVCDFVVVFVHWGIERNEMFVSYQQQLAYQYIDAGADFVVGSHPHCMQGIEYYKGKPICYSLSNFLFGNYYSRTTVLQLVVASDNTSDVYYMPCGSQGYYTFNLEEQDKINEFYRYMESISVDIHFDENGKVISKSPSD